MDWRSVTVPTCSECRTAEDNARTMLRMYRFARAVVIGAMIASFVAPSLLVLALLFWYAAWWLTRPTFLHFVEKGGGRVHSHDYVMLHALDPAVIASRGAALVLDHRSQVITELGAFVSCNVDLQYQCRLVDGLVVLHDERGEQRLTLRDALFYIETRRLRPTA